MDPDPLHAVYFAALALCVATWAVDEWVLRRRAPTMPDWDHPNWWRHPSHSRKVAAVTDSILEKVAARKRRRDRIQATIVVAAILSLVLGTAVALSALVQIFKL